MNVRRRHNRVRFPLLAAVLLCAAACENGSDLSRVVEPSLVVKVLGSGTYTSGGESWSYQLLRLPNAAGGFAYVQWFPPPSGAAAPVIVLARPYDGIDWTGEAVDSRWSARGNGCHADEDGPDFSATTSGTTCYALQSPQAGADESVIHLLNGFGVLAVFGRFYAGGDIWNDVQDMAAGFEFLRSRTDVDTSRIGVFGASWGGFLSLYGAAYAPRDAAPAVGVALFPVSDFSSLITHIDNLPNLVAPANLPSYSNFFDPYVRRILKSTGGRPGRSGADYTRFTASAVGQRLTGRMLIAHDDGDTLIPATHSRNFAASYPAIVEPFWYQQGDSVPYDTNMLSHGPIIQPETMYAPIYTFSLAYLYTAIAATTRTTLQLPYAAADMDAFFTDIRTYQLSGRTVNWIVPRLRELCDDRVVMIDLTPPASPPPTTPGRALVAAQLNAHWSTSYTPDGACGQLASGLPP